MNHYRISKWNGLTNKESTETVRAATAEDALTMFRQNCIHDGDIITWICPAADPPTYRTDEDGVIVGKSIPGECGFIIETKDLAKESP